MSEPTIQDALQALTTAITALANEATVTNAEKEALITFANAFKTAPVLGGNLNLGGYKILNNPTDEMAPRVVTIESDEGVLLNSPDNQLPNAAFPDAAISASTGASTTLYTSDNGKGRRIEDVAEHSFVIPSDLPERFNLTVLNPFAADVSFSPADVAESVVWVRGAPAVGSAYTQMFLYKASPTLWEIY